MSARRVLSTTGDVALELLRLTAASSDVFPPLRSVANGALHAAEIVKRFRSNKSQWQDFGGYIQDATASVLQSLARADASQDDTRKNLGNLLSILESVIKRIQSEQALQWHKRFGRFIQDPEMIANMRKQVDDVLALFQLSTTVTMMDKVGVTFDAVVVNGKTLSHIAHDTSKIAALTTSISQNSTLEKLERVKNSSWDPYRVCLDNTRAELIRNIVEWIDGADSSGTTMMLLTAVAGAGKTTLAHTVAQLCKTRNRLASSFFFDRSTAGRDNSGALFSTIAYDLARLDKRLAAIITAAIEEDRSLPLAPISRQFEELVLAPCREVSLTGPVVIVIDALDEAWDDTMIEILRDRACDMPSTIRIFMTSRMRPELDSLCRKEHVLKLDIEIREQENINDMAEYVSHRLRRLANERNLGSDWPGQGLRTEFEKRAGGLFLWVATICDYLRQRSNPTAELQELVAGTNMPTTKAEEQMDKLYATILGSFDWSDDSFSEDYGRLIGVAIASKIPMTISAMRELYYDHSAASEYTLQRLSPLLTGMRDGENGKQPVGLLHQSLRDFLAIRAPRSTEYAHFHIAEKEKSAELALLCLTILNRELNHHISTVGYLEKDPQIQPGVPKTEPDTISEALWYACQFWPDHLIDADASADVKCALVHFMENKLVTWLEIVASRGRCRVLEMLQEWMQGQRDGCDEKYADACLSLCDRLEYDDRLEEALTIAGQGCRLYRQLATDDRISHMKKLASSLVKLSNILSLLGQKEDALTKIHEAIEMYRQLAEHQPAAYTPDLASSLKSLSTYLSYMGRKKEALSVIQEAVEIGRRLATKQPAAHTSDLAWSLNDLSIRLSHTGRRKEALLAIQEAVQIRRRLAADRPAAYTPVLAMSLNNLSNHLSYMGRKEKALVAIQEAVEIRRRLAADRSATYTPVLASSLNNLSNHLSYMGRREEALVVIREAVEIRRQLAADRPAAYNPDLAMSLNSLSNHLSYMGRREEALVAIQEAVEIRRRLATDRPVAYTPDLAMSLSNLSNRLSDMGKNQEALPLFREVLQLYRSLSISLPLVFTPKLSGALRDFARVFNALGQHMEAKALNDEADSLLLRFS